MSKISYKQAAYNQTNMALSIYVAVVSLVMAVPVFSWKNVFDQELNFQCPPYSSISRVVSEHNNHFEDRVFDFECKQLTNYSESCAWSDYVNNYDEAVVYQCPKGGTIDGISSIHSNSQEDRKWKFYCCEQPGMCLYNCHYSGWVNNYDAHLDYMVSAGYFLRGVTSIHSNSHEDRRFEFEVCKMMLCEEYVENGGKMLN